MRAKLLVGNDDIGFAHDGWIPPAADFVFPTPMAPGPLGPHERASAVDRQTLSRFATRILMKSTMAASFSEVRRPLTNRLKEA